MIGQSPGRWAPIAGTGTITFAGGSISGYTSDLNIANPIVLPNARTAVTIDGNNNITLSGPVTLTGAGTVSRQQPGA